MGFGGRAEDGEDERDTAADWFGAVESRCLRQKELFLAVRCLPRCDGGSVEVDGDRISRGKASRQDIVTEVNYRLGHGGGYGDRGRFVLALHFEEAVCAGRRESLCGSVSLRGGGWRGMGGR